MTGRTKFELTAQVQVCKERRKKTNGVGTPRKGLQAGKFDMHNTDQTKRSLIPTRESLTMVSIPEDNLRKDQDGMIPIAYRDP